MSTEWKQPKHEQLDEGRGIQVGGATIGFSRPNQDAVVARTNQYGAFAAAIDGVSDSYHGELAANVAANTIQSVLRNCIPHKENLVESLVKANRNILNHPFVKNEEEASEAMITLAGIYQNSKGFFADIVQAGNTVAYLLRAAPRQRTELVKISYDLLEPDRLGMGILGIDTLHLPMQPGEQLILMTQGAYKPLLPHGEFSSSSDTLIMTTLRNTSPAKAATIIAKRAQRLASQSGQSREDITVAVLAIPGQLQEPDIVPETGADLRRRVKDQPLNP